MSILKCRLNDRKIPARQRSNSLWWHPSSGHLKNRCVPHPPIHTSALSQGIIQDTTDWSGQLTDRPKCLGTCWTPASCPKTHAKNTLFCFSTPAQTLWPPVPQAWHPSHHKWEKRCSLIPTLPPRNPSVASQSKTLGTPCLPQCTQAPWLPVFYLLFFTIVFNE